MKSRIVSLGLVLALGYGLLMAPSRAASDNGPAASPHNGCSLRSAASRTADDDLTTVPFWRLIQHASHPHVIRLPVDGADKFIAAIAPLDDDMRRLVLLFAVWDAMAWPSDGLSLFFETDSGAIAPLARTALQEAGLTREAEAFGRAMALFGERYPADTQARKAFFASGTPSPRLSRFDRQMLAAAAQFGSREKFSKRIVESVNGRPALWQRIEARRQTLGDGDRMRALINALQRRVDLWQPAAQVERQLDSLSRPQRALLAMATFTDEFWNGGVHQFFYNSSGSVAPDVLDAMIELGLTRGAALFRRALDMFEGPYLRDTQRRRETAFKGGWNAWDQQLSALTNDFYASDGGPGFEDAMIRYARQHHLLPC